MKEGGVDDEVLDAVVKNLHECEPGAAPSSSVAHAADFTVEPDTATAASKLADVE